MQTKAIAVKAPLTQPPTTLKAGDRVLLSGEIYTGRDAAHARMTQAIKNGEPLPFDLKNAIIYYTGPCPPKPGAIIGSCGPTTSSRMDAYAPLLIQHGLRGMIGKGGRDESVVQAMRDHGAVYFAATGGAGALLSKCVKECVCAAYEDLGTEAVYRLQVVDFPLIVAIDSEGNSLYKK